MTYSEMREAYLLSKSLNKDIYIGMSHKFYLYHICLTYVSMEGSTHVTTPRQFIDDLRVLELGGVGSRSIPNGIGPLLDKKRSPQEFYDQRYYSRDPPARAALPTQPAPSTKGRPIRPSPVPSQAPSQSSQISHTQSQGSSYGEEKEKKKKRFFHF